MNLKLVDSLLQIIDSLTQEERQFLNARLSDRPVPALRPHSTPQGLLDLENQLRAFEMQYDMSSEDFYHRFHAGDLNDVMDYFEWSVFYDMWQSAQAELKAMPLADATDVEAIANLH